LKLRRFADGSGELIAYQRPDTSGPTGSRYVLSPIPDPDSCSRALAAVLGVRGVVRKVRTLYLAGRTRIHMDDVEGLGHFVELEVVLAPDEPEGEGIREAHRLMGDLGIREEDLLREAYIDLLDR
jgi:predicted adenylyl cyclase CyaB